jgi:hypothetical protein
MDTQTGKISKGLLAAILVVVIGALIGGIGYWLSTKDSTDASDTIEKASSTEVEDDKTSSPESATADETPYCSTGLTQYVNELIGLEFCYPTSWGMASISAPQASESLAGSGYEISFADYSVVVSSITSDYQNTVGRDGRCEDPENTPPNFSLYSNSWVKDSADSELSAAVRYPVKKDDIYLVQENVNSFFFGLCYSALINQTGTAYPVVKVALRRELGSVSVLQYTENPELVLSEDEKVEFLAVVDSVRKP